MSKPGHEDRILETSDGYPVHVAVWPVVGQPVKAQVVVLHGVQSHSGWYHSLGRTLAGEGFHTSFPDRRGSGPNRKDRGHAPSGKRIVLDVVEWLQTLRREQPALPIVLAGISWGGKPVVIAAAEHSELIDGLALICPGLLPRVGVSLGEKLRIAWAFFTNRRKMFPIPLSDPALFTASKEGQAFIAADSHGLREGTAGLLASSFFIDRRVARVQSNVKQPALLMTAGQDRIVDNSRTVDYFHTLGSVDRTVIDYPDGHHTLEFEPDPTLYAIDLARWIEGHVLTNLERSPAVQTQG